jgi:hypothetical protein
VVAAAPEKCESGSLQRRQERHRRVDHGPSIDIMVEGSRAYLSYEMRMKGSVNHIALMATFVRTLQAGNPSATAKQYRPADRQSLPAHSGEISRRALAESIDARMNLTEAGHRCDEHTRALLRSAAAFSAGAGGAEQPSDGAA